MQTVSYRRLTEPIGLHSRTVQYRARWATGGTSTEHSMARAAHVIRPTSPNAYKLRSSQPYTDPAGHTPGSAVLAAAGAAR